MVENFRMKFQMDPDLPSVLVMQSSTHFREVLNEMLQGDTGASITEIQRTSTPRLPPIHLTDEESEVKDIENENSTKNIGKLLSSQESESVENIKPAKLEKTESIDSEFLQVPETSSEDIDVKNTNTQQPSIRLESGGFAKKIPEQFKSKIK